MNEPTHEADYRTQHTAPPPPARPAPAATYVDSRRKKPWFATLLSFLPGVGQVYVGYYQRGVAHAVIFALLIGIMSTEVEAIMPMIAILLAFFFLYNLVDAWRRAALYNYALEGGTEIALPDDFKMPGFSGSIAGGATLVAVGSLLLAHTRFGFSLDWIEEWWPAAIIAFGAYLAYKAIQDKTGDG